MPAPLPAPRRRPRRASLAAAAGAGALGVALVLGGVGGSPVAAPPRAPFPVDLETAGVQQLQRGLARGTFTSAELTAAYLARIDALNSRGPSLNAVRSLHPGALRRARALDAERAAGDVRGPLHGIPVLLKDNIDVEGLPTTAGSVALARSFPAGDATVTERLERAGAIVLGKTNLTEFANFLADGMPSGYSSLGGQVLNPYDVDETPSGSSAGSGSAAAAALAAVTVGTETSGSILSPSRANSLVGVKPTVGLVSRTGIVPISASQDTAGPMVRYVYDAAALLGAMTGVDRQDPATLPSRPHARTDYTRALSTRALQGARIGYVASPPPAPGEPDPAPVYLAALEELRRQGARLVEVEVGTTDAPSVLEHEFERDLDAYLARLPEDAPMDTMDDVIAFNRAHRQEALKYGQERMLVADELSLEEPGNAAAYRRALREGRRETRAAIDTAMRRTDGSAANDLDAIVSPSLTTGVGARAGYPSVVVPAGYTADDRKPVGLVLLGQRWSEATLLALAYDYEQASRAWRPPSEVNPSLFRCTDVDRDTAYDLSCAP